MKFYISTISSLYQLFNSPSKITTERIEKTEVGQQARFQ